MDELQLLNASNYVELSLHECGKEQCIPDKSFHFTEKNYHLFHYVLSGQGTFVLNNIEYQIKEGMIFYIPPNCQPVYYPNHNNPWTYIWIGMNGSNVPNFLNLINCSEKNPIIVDKERKILPYFESIYEEYRFHGTLNLKCLEFAYIMIDTMINLNYKKNKSHKNITNKESYIKVAKEYILNNYQFNIKIDDIANNVGVTPNYLANVFTQVEKVSPKEYLTSMRMEKARLLLMTNRYKVREVGEMVGYKNQLHFSNEFKKRNGLSPQNYLVKNMKEEK